MGGTWVRRRIANAELLELVQTGHTNKQIAEHFGCTVRTIDRRRAEDPHLNQAIIGIRAELAAAATPEHGTTARYRRGCHCAACRSANTQAHYAFAMRRREKAGTPPPDPNRGRRRSNAQVSQAGRIDNPSPRTLIEQAIARGAATSWIMNAHGVDYATVQLIRDELDAAAVA